MSRLRPTSIASAAAWVGLVLLVAPGCEPTNEGYAPTQPIAFSHAVHAGANRIDCGYCHGGAMESRHAGVPAAQTCMNCHAYVVPDHPEIQKVAEALESETPIAWTRIHKMPAHTYFHHGVHVQAGVACGDCHGPVESMGRTRQWSPMTMGTCVDCHREVGAQAFPDLPHAARSNPLTDCSTCHH
jgi:hypothetical protein